MFNFLRRIPKEYKSALSETLLILVLTIAPTIISSLNILLNMNATTHYDDLFKSGEFFLYGVSFLGSSFLIFQSVNKKGYLVLCFIIILSLAYTVVLNTDKPNMKLIPTLSLICLIICVIISYYGQVLFNKNRPIDVQEFRHDEQERIQNALN